jgi:serine/alanine adding enzyme
MSRRIKVTDKFMFKLELNKDIDFTAWQDFILENKYASPFQSIEFVHFCKNGNTYKPVTLAITENGKIIAICVVALIKESGIKGFFSRRAIIFGGPMIVEKREDVFRFLLINLEKVLENRVIYIEIRNYFDYSRFDHVFNAHGWRFIPYLNFQINIKNRTTEDVLKGMKYNRRREIKLSIKNGAIYGLATQISDAHAVYEILHDLYKNRVKLPLPDFEFFKAFIDSELAKIFVVKFEEKVIAGSFCLYLENKNLFTLYYCGVREINRKIFPTSLAIYAALEFAAKNNISIVDLMGAGQPDEEYGVRDFKAQFGGELVEHGRYLKILNPFLYRIGKAGLKLISKL